MVVRAQRGDAEAFACIVNASYERFRGVALRLLRDSQLAEDASQQAYVNIWRNLPRLREPGRYEAWSYRLLLRACYAEFGRSPQWLPAVEEGHPGEPSAVDPGYSAVIDRDQLERGFRRLSMDHRVVVVLHHYLDMPIERVAAILDLPVGTVKSRLHRALEGMRAALEADSRGSETPFPMPSPATPSTRTQVLR